MPVTHALPVVADHQDGTDAVRARCVEAIRTAWSRSSRPFTAQYVFEERARLARSPLTDATQERVLETIVEHGPIRLSDVAEHTSMTVSNASKVTDALVRAGLVERATPPTDRRVTLLVTTARGREVSDRLVAVSARLLAERLDRFSTEDVEALARLLDAFSLEVERWSAALRTSPAAPAGSAEG